MFLQFPIGMGTGAVYVTLSGLKEHASVLTHVETFFYFLNMALFILNVTTLAVQLARKSKFSLISFVQVDKIVL